MRTSFCTLLLLLRLSAFSATLPIGLLVFLPAPSCLHGMSTLQVGVTRVTIRFLGYARYAPNRNTLCDCESLWCSLLSGTISYIVDKMSCIILLRQGNP